MKILAIIGSPKGRGSGYKIVRNIESHMQELIDVEFEYLFLKEQDLQMCRGCFVCVTRGEKLCPLKDDRGLIEEKIDNSDGVILVSPSYVSNVSWIMKNFIDRFCYTNHRPRFFRQKLMLVSNAGAGMEDTIKALRHTLGAGPQIAAELSYLSPPWPLSARVRKKQDAAVIKQTRRFFDAIERDAERGGLPETPGFSAYLRYRFFRKISQDVKDYLKADYEYYRNMKDYYYETRISLWKRIAATAMLKISMIMMRDMAPDEAG